MFRPEILSYNDIRTKASDFLDEFHEERTLPVPIEEIVEFDFRIEVIPIDGILDDLDVDAFLTSDRRRIYVDEYVMKKRISRLRFSLAHEIAHHELHGPLYDNNQIHSVRDWHRVQESIGQDDYSWFEFQANAMAGLILVPTEQLAAEHRNAMAMARRAGISESTLDSEAGRATIARSLAATFQVSEQVIEKRMEKDGLSTSSPAPHFER